MLSNAYFLAKFRFDTAENEPAPKITKQLLVLLTVTRQLAVDVAIVRGGRLAGATAEAAARSSLSTRGGDDSKSRFPIPKFCLPDLAKFPTSAPEGTSTLWFSQQTVVTFTQHIAKLCELLPTTFSEFSELWQVQVININK